MMKLKVNGLTKNSLLSTQNVIPRLFAFLPPFPPHIHLDLLPLPVFPRNPLSLPPSLWLVLFLLTLCACLEKKLLAP